MRLHRKFALLTVFVLLLNLLFGNLAFAADLQDNRLWGDNRYDTAVAISKAGWPDGADTVIIATGRDNFFADALAASLLGAVYNAPILITQPDRLSDETKEEILRLSPDTIYVVGGEAVVSKDVFNELKMLVWNTQRVAGSNRYETAKEIAKKAGASFEKAFVATGLEFDPALKICAAAAKEKTPILYADARQVDFLLETVGELGIKSVEIVGDLDLEVWSALLLDTDLDVSSIEADSLEIAEKYFPDPAGIIIAQGTQYADAFTGSSYAAKKGWPIVLLPKGVTVVPDEVMQYINRQESIVDSVVLGGYLAVSDEVLASINETVGARSQFRIVSATAVTNTRVEIETDRPVKKVSPSQFTIFTSSSSQLEVKKAEVADYDPEGKTILLTTAEQSPNTLYTVFVNNQFVSFIGLALDTGKPVILGEPQVDYREVRITYNKKIDISNATFTITGKNVNYVYLTIKGVSLDKDRQTIILTTDSHEPVLYELTISGVKSLYGVPADAQTLTFVGKKDSEADQAVIGANVLNSRRVEVRFAVNVDPLAAVEPYNYIVKEKYGLQRTIPISNVTLKPNSKDTVILTFTEDLQVSTLYEVTVSNVPTVFGKPLGSDRSETFVGQGADTSKLNVMSALEESNQKVKVFFDDDLNEELALDVRNYSIREMYGSRKPLAVLGVEIRNNDGDDTNNTGSTQPYVLLTTEKQEENTLYEITVVNLTDDSGNPLENRTAYFVGKGVLDRIKAVTAVLDPADDTKLILTFDQPVDGESARDISHYYIEGLGYPAAASVDGVDNTKVILTIPSTIDGKIYTVKVSQLQNIDKVKMNQEISTTFVGRGRGEGLPQIVAVIAKDSQTLTIHFDRPVTHSSISGKLITADMTDVLDNTFYYTQYKVGGEKFEIDPDISSAFIDSENDNVLVIRMNAPSFMRGDGYSLYVLTVEGENAQKIIAGSAPLVFAGNNDPVKAPTITNVAGLDTRTIDVYFDQPIKESSVDTMRYTGTLKETNDFKIVRKADGQIMDIRNVVRVSDTHYRIVMDEDMKLVPYLLYVKQGTRITDMTGQIPFGDTLVSDTGYRMVFEFAGSNIPLKDIKDIKVAMKNSRTIEVYFPEPMDENDVLNPFNYRIVRAGNPTQSAGSATISYVRYDASQNKATLYLNQSIGYDSVYGLGIKSTIRNALDTKTVAKDITNIYWINSGVVIDFVRSDLTPQAPKVIGVTVSEDRKKLYITMDQVVAVDDDGLGITDTIFEPVAMSKFASSRATAGWNGIADTIILDLFTINAELTNGGKRNLTLADLKDFGASLSQDGTTFTVELEYDTFKKGTQGWVSTEPSVETNKYKLYGLTGIPAERGVGAVKVPFGVSNQ